jgi:hypothetical protein
MALVFQESDDKQRILCLLCDEHHPTLKDAWILHKSANAHILTEFHQASIAREDQKKHLLMRAEQSVHEANKFFQLDSSPVAPSAHSSSSGFLAVPTPSLFENHTTVFQDMLEAYEWSANDFLAHKFYS